MAAAAFPRSPGFRAELPLLGVTVLVAETLLILGYSANIQPTRPALLVALALDIIVVGGLLIALPLKRAGGPRALSLTVPKAVRAVAIGMAVAALGMRWMDLPMRALAAVSASAELLVAGVVILALLRVALTTGRGDIWDRAREQLSAVVPRPVLEFALLEIRLLAAAGASLLRRPLPTVPPGAFTTTKRSAYG